MVEIYCFYCGNIPKIKSAYIDIDTGQTRLGLEPCQDCMDSEKETAYSKGYDD